ncbi:serine/threonine-protein kinase [Gemmata sp. JC717]|uniref:serine/threonine-protein kinase n=1 Tax=Gemmata algarum TaxID=2975278 RepID=UPI0021BADC9B|nr:serine/threonine-protein kinase [Gemmata algarum]MDY3556252.1 serine/threonine-protein kinase [Gemmata algarum]
MSERAEGVPQQTSNGAAAPLTAGAPVPGLSSWVLERRLGAGGFGEVWMARHAWNAKEPPRAVKFCTDPGARLRLVTHEKNVVLRVMRYAGAHPNIVPLLECNLDGDVPWLMYEFVEGGTLASALAQWRSLPLTKRMGRAVRTLYALASALAVFHRLHPPLIHRDLKPHNVLMAGGKVPRIIDFGIGGVAVPRDVEAAGTALAARVPTGLQAAGSANYAPVEQRLGSPPDPRDDVHALGVIAYQALVGDVTVAPGPDVKDELRQLRVPGELVALIASSVATNPDRRPKDAGEWEAALAELMQRAQRPSEAVPLSVSELGAVPVVPPAPERELVAADESALTTALRAHHFTGGWWWAPPLLGLLLMMLLLASALLYLATAGRG